MADATTPAPRTPWHLWVVGAIYLLWSLVGAFDFLMTQTRNAAYLKAFTPAQLEFCLSLPFWMVVAWAITTWGGVFGSLLLLLRKAAAVPFFWASFLCMVLMTIRNFGFADGQKVMGGTGGLVFCIVIFVVCYLSIVYARAMRRRGVLR